MQGGPGCQQVQDEFLDVIRRDFFSLDLRVELGDVAEQHGHVFLLRRFEVFQGIKCFPAKIFTGIRRYASDVSFFGQETCQPGAVEAGLVLFRAIFDDAGGRRRIAAVILVFAALIGSFAFEGKGALAALTEREDGHGMVLGNPFPQLFHGRAPDDAHLLADQLVSSP